MSPQADSLTAWIEAPRVDRGINFADDAGGWQFVPYAELAARVRRASTQLRARGVQSGDVVVVVMHTGLDLVTTIFAAWHAGAAISVVAPPQLTGPEEYIAYVESIVRTAEPTVVVTFADIEPLVAKGIAAAGITTGPELLWVYADDAQAAPAARAEPSEVAVLQFTSGSTGNPKGVRVTWTALHANLEVIRNVLGWGEDDGLSNWVPLHHDMGLVGGLFHPATQQSNLWLLRPDQFIRDPATWLETFAPGLATATAVPSFALAYAGRRVRPERLAELDLSGMRCLVLGSEAADPVALQKFSDFATPRGFDPASYMPAYGMAENVLLNTVGGRDRRVHIARVDWSTVRFGGRVTVLETAILTETRIEPEAGWVVSAGFPEPGDDIHIEIVDEDGQPVGADVVGEVLLSGSSVTGSYYRNTETDVFTADGKIRTGDGAFVHDGRIYVLGRLGNSLKLLGRSIYAEEVDAKVAAVTGLSRGRLMAVCTNDAGKPRLLLFAEGAPAEWAEQAKQCVRDEYGSALDVTVIIGGPGMLQRTTSGKPRRRHMWQLFSEGRLAEAVVA